MAACRFGCAGRRACDEVDAGNDDAVAVVIGSPKSSLRELAVRVVQPGRHAAQLPVQELAANR